MQQTSDTDNFQLAKQNCIFCKIVNKEMNSSIIFEDELSIAILDINPAENGHILLMPKEHYMLMHMVPDHTLGHLSVVSKYLSELLIESLNCEDVSIFIANGSAAGQQSQHFMIHLIPKYKSSDKRFDISGEKVSQQELDKICNDIRSKLNELNKN